MLPAWPTVFLTVQIEPTGSQPTEVAAQSTCDIRLPNAERPDVVYHPCMIHDPWWLVSFIPWVERARRRLYEKKAV